MNSSFFIIGISGNLSKWTVFRTDISQITDLGYWFLYTACMLSHFSCVWLFTTLWTLARQAPLSMGFSRQGYWRGLPLPPPGGLPDPGTKTASPVSPALQADSLPTEPPSYCVAKVLSLFFRINSFFPTYAKIFLPSPCVVYLFIFLPEPFFFFF